MQKFIDYVKQPSNYEDFVNIFDSEAKFKPTQPPEAQRKEFFKQNLVEIMKSYIPYLIKQQIVEAKSQAEFLTKFEKGQIQHTDLVMNFACWLDSEDRTYTIQAKQKPVQPARPTPPLQPRIYAPTPAQPSPIPQNPIQKQYAAKSSNNQARNFLNDNKRQHPINTNGPYSFSKVERPQPPQSHTHTNQQRPQHYHNIPHSQVPKHVPNVPPHSTQPKKNYPHHNTTSHNQIPTMQHYTPNLPDQSKPFRLRFYQKLADYFEYPERVGILKQDLALMFQHKKG